MNHLVTDIAIDRTLNRQSVHRLCRRRRRRRRRAEKGGGIYRPNQLGKIKGDGTWRPPRPRLHGGNAARHNSLCVPLNRAAPRRACV